MSSSALTVKILLPLLTLLSAPQSSATVDEPDSIHTFREVVVTGVSTPVAENLQPYTVSIVGRQRLESIGQTQVLSAISGMVPGLFVTQRSVFGFGVSNGGAGHIKLRGVGGDRASAVLMMVDGQPQFAGIYSHHIADFYDKEYVERVEVLRGPASVLYGSNAMAGTINVITRNALSDGSFTTISSQYGSYNTWLSSITNTTRRGRFSSLVSLSHNRTDGTSANFDFRQSDGYVKLSYDFSAHWKAYADYSLMHFRGNDPIYPTLSNPESTDIYRQSVTRSAISAVVTDSYDVTGGNLRIYYSRGSHYIDDPRHFHSRDSRFGVMASQNFRPWRGADASLGFDFDRYWGEIPMSGGKEHQAGSLATLASKYVTEYSPYATLTQRFGNNLVTIDGGFRMALSDRFRAQAVPQFGISVNPTASLTIKANAAMGFRNPSFRELYLYRMANPYLEPERMWNYELSVSKSLSRLLQADLTVYYSSGSNMIQTLDMKNVNTGHFINKGVEITLKSNPASNLRLFASYSYLHTSLANLTGAPKNQYYLGADLTLFDKLKLSADLKGVGSLFVSDGMRHRSYALLNFKIGYRICRHLQIFTRLENITDAGYVINRGYTMPGFTAMGGFKLSF